MALTRMRVVTGDEALGARVAGVAQTAINSNKSEERTAEILDMRARMMRDKPAKGPWDLNLRKGGLVDVEFITQHDILTASVDQVLCPRLRSAQKQLCESGEWTAAECETLTEAYTFLQALLQVQRMAHGEIATEQDQSQALQDRLCRAVDCTGFTGLSSRLEKTCAEVSELFSKKIGDPATET